MARTRVGLGTPPPTAKSKTKTSLDRPKTKDIIGVLNLLPAVAALPQEFTEDQKVWWNKYIGKRFRGKVAKRGKKWDNARTWTYSKFIGDFCDDFYPRLTEDKRKQYHILIGHKVYSYLTNHSSRRSSGITIKTKPMKRRVYAQDIWRRRNPDAFNKAWEAHKAEHPEAVLNVGTRRALTGTFFQSLPKEEQEKYRTMAKDKLKSIQSHQQLNGDAKHRYADTYIKQMAAFSTQAELCAGIRTSTIILAEDENGRYKITLLMSDGLEDFRKVPAVVQHVHALKKWVEERAGKPVQAETPSVTVYPDYANEMYPLVPDITGMRLNELQKTCRTYISMVYSFQCGYYKVPWELISSSPIDDWIAPDRRPEGVSIKDPSGMTLPVVLVWLNYFHECQDGTIPAARRFQFRQVIVSPSPIDESHSQESSRRQEFFPQHNKQLWISVFEETVSKCHAVEGMQYTEQSLEYARFVTNRQLVPVDQEDPPEWLELPARDPGDPVAVIDGEEKELILKLAAELPEAQRDLVIELVDAVNEHQNHVPASSADGLWADDSVVPAILPSSLPAFTDALPLLRRFWAPVGYYLASGKAPIASTWGYFRLWQEDMLTSYIVLHQPSGTLLGGHTGCVWVVRALILLVFNFAAVTGDLKPPVPPPSRDYDLSRLPVNELEHLLGNCRVWIEKIHASTEILKQTSDDRCNPRHRRLHSPEAVEDTDAEPVAAAGPAQPANSKPRRGKKRKNKGKGKGKSRARSAGDSTDEDMSPPGSDESDDPELNYDAMDGGSDEGSDDGTGIGWGGFGALNRESDSEDENPPVTPKRSSQKAARAASTPSPASESSQPPRPAGDGETNDLISNFPSALLDKHVFGPFYALPPVSKQSLPTTYREIYEGFQAALKTISDTLKEWGALAADHPILRREDVDAAERVSSKLPAEWQPLLHFLIARRLAWKRAENIAPTVLEFAPRLILAAREAFRLDSAVTRYCQNIDTAEGSGDESLDTLERLQTKAMMGTAELCWCYKELQAFEKLSTLWKHDSGDAWLHDTLTHDVPTLLALAHPLVKWADAAQELDEKLRQRRRQMWAPTGRPFDKHHATTSLWYWFGSPHPDELPDGLHECVASALKVYRNEPPHEPSTQPVLNHNQLDVDSELDKNSSEEAHGRQGEGLNPGSLEAYALTFVQQMVKMSAEGQETAGTEEAPGSRVTAEDAAYPAPAPSISPSLPTEDPASSAHPPATTIVPPAPPANVATSPAIPAVPAAPTAPAIVSPASGVPAAESPTPTAPVTLNPDGANQGPSSVDNGNAVPSPAPARKPRKSKPSDQHSTPANTLPARSTRSAAAAASAHTEQDPRKTRAGGKRVGESADDTPKTRSKRGKGNGK